MGSAIRMSVLMCHAPVVLPEVAGERAPDCARSTRAMGEAARRLVDARPDGVIVLSPHTPRHEDAFGIVTGDRIEGDFARFGAPSARVRLPNSLGAAAAILAEARRAGAPMRELPSTRDLGGLDHGAAVPLWFVTQAGWDGPTAVLSFPYSPGHAECRALGTAIERAAASDGGNWAVLASGDMSHRLIPDAPAGFDPKGKDFDAFVSERVARGHYDEAVRVDPVLRDLAAEDVVDSLEIAAQASGFRSAGKELLSYEGPFGVGYLVAILFDGGATGGAASRERFTCP